MNTIISIKSQLLLIISDCNELQEFTSTESPTEETAHRSDTEVGSVELFLFIFIA